MLISIQNKVDKVLNRLNTTELWVVPLQNRTPTGVLIA